MQSDAKIPYEMGDAGIYVPIPVSKFDTALKFYCDVLGFKVVFEEAKEMGWLELSSPVNGVRIGLDLKEKVETRSNSAVICFNVADIEKTKNFLDDSGVKTSEIQDIPNMVSMFDAWDPFGNIVQFIGNPRIKS